ncbi:hypothetical protein ACVGVM_05775 [Pseudonocardia bannensis]|uniref:ABC transporter permease n=1 Tax=Pseudonocardia bannensis TaxID=630973 RepID=A0A848DKN2_9PSEU|nr:hypothetical protein [Pseudonocardia bannensis]NMH93290.1 hypothetical protein [Pseudonocardia bannensis]
MPGLLRAEARKIASTRLWWALLIPVSLLTVSINLFGSFVGMGLGDLGGDPSPVLLASLAYALGLTGVFAAVHGIVSAAGEFRHRTITTTYLASGGRGRVLVAKMLAAGVVGVGYAATAVLLGLVAGLIGQGDAWPPALGALATVAGTGLLVCWLWSVIGVALGTVLTNQVAVLVLGLVYILAGENVLSVALTSGGDRLVEPSAFARLAAYLPVNAGDVALYDLPARELAGERYGPLVVEQLVGVAEPPPGWVALLVLAVWAAAAAATGWVVGGRRDVT